MRLQKQYLNLLTVTATFRKFILDHFLDIFTVNLLNQLNSFFERLSSIPTSTRQQLHVDDLLRISLLCLSNLPSNFLQDLDNIQMNDICYVIHGTCCSFHDAHIRTLQHLNTHCLQQRSWHLSYFILRNVHASLFKNSMTFTFL